MDWIVLMALFLIRQLCRVRHVAQSLRSEQGGTLIETALVLPIVLLMTFGFIDFSLMIFGMGNANFASRAALRYATLHSSTSYSPTTQHDLNSIVGAYIFSFPTNTWSVTSNYQPSNVVGAGVSITVTVTYNLNVLGYTQNGISCINTGVGSVQQ